MECHDVELEELCSWSVSMQQMADSLINSPADGDDSFFFLSNAVSHLQDNGNAAVSHLYYSGR